MDLHPLKPEHPVGQFQRRQIFAVIELADGEVLAEPAFQTAPGEKDGPGPATPGNGGLFTMMDICRSNSGPKPCPTNAGLPGYPVNTAVMGTKVAPPQPFVGGSDTVKQFAGMVKIVVVHIREV
jgi:hypothetical protein